MARYLYGHASLWFAVRGVVVGAGSWKRRQPSPNDVSHRSFRFVPFCSVLFVRACVYLMLLLLGIIYDKSATPSFGCFLVTIHENLLNFAVLILLLDFLFTYLYTHTYT